MKKSWYHLVARTQRGLFPFWQRRLALPLWHRLQLEFRSNTLAAVIMPDHIHLLIESSKPDHIHQRLGVLLGSFTRRHFPGQNLWQKIPAPQKIADLQKLENTTRYIHLNPCRRSYTPNPWAWEFSTLWDHTGWSISLGPDLTPWVSQGLIDSATGYSLQTWSKRHSTFILRDPAVCVFDSAPRQPLEELSDVEFDCLMNRALKAEISTLKFRDPIRDLEMKFRAQIRAGGKSQRELASLLHVNRSRLGAILQKKLTHAEIAYFERHAWWVRHGGSREIAGPKLDSKSELITEFQVRATSRRLGPRTKEFDITF
jgi:REP element-mobilizing transposase RayT